MSKENSKRIREITAFAAALIMVGAFSLPSGTEIMGVRLGGAIVASAEESYDEGFQLYYEVNSDGNTVTITRNAVGGSYVIIPNEIDGKTVTAIGNMAFDNCSNLIGIEIPNSVTSIGEYAFSGCTSLTSITIPNSVTSIGYGAFYYCTSLTSITIPDSVTSIGDYAFYNCSSLTGITIPDSVTSIGDSFVFANCNSLINIIVDDDNLNYSSKDGVLFNKTKTTLIQYPIGKSGESYVIPDGVESIGNGAIAKCKGLTSITIPDSVSSIGMQAFNNCTGLTSITIPGNVTSIGSGTFRNCSNLTSIFLPNGATVESDAIPTSATQIKYTVDANGNVTITGATLGSDQTSVVIPEKIGGKGVTAIGVNTFNGCSSLESITIPDSVTSIGDNAFISCTSLKSITLPANSEFKCIPSFCFKDCSSLTSITIPDSVTSIGNNAFELCSKLKSVTIPNSVTSIGKWAFANCTNLTSITIPDSVTSIEENVFFICSNLESVTIPSSVTSIGDYAFANCTNLTSVIIPKSVTSIEKYAFEYCSNLKSIFIPNSLTSIGTGAIDGTTTKVRYTVDDEGNATITEVTLGEGQTSFDIPSTIGGNPVTDIADDALVKCPDVKHDHKEKTAATCTKKPVCSICGQGYGEALGHDHSGDWQNDTDEHWRVCARDNCTEILDKASHDFDEGVITTEPTEDAEGVKTYTCEICGYEKTEAIPVTEPSIPDDPAEKVNSFVERLYENVLGRPSDPSKESHIDNLNNGETATKVAYDFVFSPEFTELDISNEERVTIMYNTFLNRDPDPAGLETWTKALDNGCSIGHIFYGFTQSGEFGEICDAYGIEQGTWEYVENRDKSAELTAFVSRLYTKALNRTYDVNGLNDHTGTYLENHDLYQMAYNFIFSPEFMEKNLSDEEFVDTMYRTFFDREADPDGKADWLDRMSNQGWTREGVLAGFVGSQECANMVARFGI